MAALTICPDRESADAWVQWVPAAPFRAWLGHLSAATGFDSQAIAVAAGVPTAVARSLAQGSSRPRRIRAIDAKNLLALDAATLLERGSAMADAAGAHRALAQLGPWQPGPEQLARCLGVNTDTACGLADGWLSICRRSVVWHCVALAQDIMHARTAEVLRHSPADGYRYPFIMLDGFADDSEDDSDDYFETALAA